jgi:hypothetical protein
MAAASPKSLGMSVREARDSTTAMRDEIYKYAVSANAASIKYTPSSYTVAPPPTFPTNQSLGQLVAQQSMGQLVSTRGGAIVYQPSPTKPAPTPVDPTLYWNPNPSHLYNF